MYEKVQNKNDDTVYKQQRSRSKKSRSKIQLSRKENYAKNNVNKKRKKKVLFKFKIKIADFKILSIWNLLAVNYKHWKPHF